MSIRHPAARRFSLQLALAGWTILGATAVAHDLWIAPLSDRPPAGSALGVELIVGASFADGEPLLPEPGSVERFGLRGPDGRETPVATPPNGYPAGVVRLASAGPHLVVYRSRPSRVELPAASFEHYLREEGLEAVAAERARRGESASPARELFSRCAKALIHAGAAGPRPGTPIWRVPVGLTLELVPENDPVALIAGGGLRVRLLYEGRPLAGALVAALSPHASRVEARSDAAGRVELALPAGGFWLVKAVHMRPAPAGTDADWESLWASLSFTAR